MSASVKPLVPFEERYRAVQRAPEDRVAQILEFGIVHTMGHPGKRHRKATQTLYRPLADFDATECTSNTSNRRTDASSALDDGNRMTTMGA